VLSGAIFETGIEQASNPACNEMRKEVLHIDQYRYCTEMASSNHRGIWSSTVMFGVLYTKHQNDVQANQRSECWIMYSLRLASACYRPKVDRTSVEYKHSLADCLETLRCFSIFFKLQRGAL